MPRVKAVFDYVFYPVLSSCDLKHSKLFKDRLSV